MLGTESINFSEGKQGNNVFSVKIVERFFLETNNVFSMIDICRYNVIYQMIYRAVYSMFVMLKLMCIQF